MPSICKKTHHLKQCVPVVIPKATITPEPATVSAYMNPLKGGLTKINNNNKKKEEPPPPPIKEGKPPPLPGERLIKRLFDKSNNKKPDSKIDDHKAKIIQNVIIDSFLDGVLK